MNIHQNNYLKCLKRCEGKICLTCTLFFILAHVVFMTDSQTPEGDRNFDFTVKELSCYTFLYTSHMYTLHSLVKIQLNKPRGISDIVKSHQNTLLPNIIEG